MQINFLPNLINIARIYKIKQQIQQNQYSMNQFAQLQPPTHLLHPILDIPTKIITDIEKGNLQISNQQKPLIKLSPNKSMDQFDNRNKILIDKIRENKNKTLQELEELENKQMELKKVIREMNKSRVEVRKIRSQFTEEEKNKIKNIYKQMKIDEQNKKKKHQIILNSFTNTLKKQRQQDEELMEKLRYQHRKAVQHNLVSMQLRKKKRQESFKDVSKRMLELKQKKYLHMMRMKTDEQIKQKQQQFRQQKLQQIKERFKLDFNQIKQHQKKYKSIIQFQTQKRQERYKTQFNKNTTARRYSKNLFSRILEKQEKQKSLQKIKKQNRAKELRWKIQQFKSIVKQKYMPRQKSQTKHRQNTPSVEQKKHQTLSHKQRFEQGVQYLKIARKLRKQKDDPKLVTEPQLIKYVDYLKTIKSKSKKSGTLQQFRSILSTEQAIDFSKANKAKNLLDQIEAKSKKTKDEKLIQSMQNKIDLLKILL